MIFSSSGVDKITTKCIKCIKHYFVPKITDCINDCLAKGSFSDSLKIAKVTPIFKSGDKKDAGNYRPVSVLPIISKIFEKIIYNRLTDYLNKIKFSIFYLKNSMDFVRGRVRCLQ